MNEDPEPCARGVRTPYATMAVLLFLLALLCGNTAAQAQFMFLDVDGDAEYSGSDALTFIQGAGTVDVYLVTNRSQFGEPAACLNGLEMGLRGYTLNLYSIDAPFSVTGVSNQMPGMVETFPLVTHPYSLSVGYSGGRTFPAGKYLLMRITLQILPTTLSAGCGALIFVPSNCYSPPGVVTGFESDCAGVSGDGMLRLGEDWSNTGVLWGCTDNTGRAPTLSCPDEVTGAEGQTLSFTGIVHDPDCDVPSFYAYSLPAGATVSPRSAFVAGEASETVTWRPAAGQAGVYHVVFEASDPDPFNMRDRRVTCSTQVTILPANAPPVAKAGGPYSGIQNVPVLFDGSQSSDPEGGSLQYQWEFGDGKYASGPTPNHAYEAGGTFSVILTVTDPISLSSRDTTSVSIASALPVRVFATKGDKATKIPDGNPFTCFQVEPTAEAAFALEEITPSSVRLHHENPTCGIIDIPSTIRKSRTIGDTDGNGSADYQVCFTRESMAALVPCLPHGKTTIPLELWGSLSSGGLVHGEFTHTFVVKDGSLEVAVSPNPLKPTSTLEFTTTKPGFVQARLFDIQGRLVATFVDESSMESGTHRVPTGSFEERAGRLPSGIYFVRVATQHNGEQSRAVMILK